MYIGFVALETFIPTDKYKEWSKLFHVEEIVSLDCALCPSLIKDLDWRVYNKLDRKIRLKGSSVYEKSGV